jgi:hypothetical protein
MELSVVWKTLKVGGDAAGRAGYLMVVAIGDVGGGPWCGVDRQARRKITGRTSVADRRGERVVNI